MLAIYPTPDTTTALPVSSTLYDLTSIRSSRSTHGTASSTPESTPPTSIPAKYTNTIPTPGGPAPGGLTPTTTWNFSVSRTPIIAYTPTQTPGPGGVVSHSNHRGALIGGVLGGFAFLALTLSLTFLYCRHRSARWAPIFARYRLGGDREKAGTGAALSPVSLPFRRRHVQSLIAVPMPHDEDYQPPESKRERLQRVRAEMEEARRLCEDLEHRSMNTVNAPGDDGVENGLERAEAVAIPAQIEQMSAMIAGLQAEVQRLAEENLPPDYSAAVGP